MQRDRDDDGRPRNARPRDGLGRPLPYGAPGTPRQPEGILRTPAETIAEAQELLDAGRPFHAHEVFEDAWKHARERGGSDTELWKALAQWAVGVTHTMRENQVGADRLLTRARIGLTPFAATTPHGIDVPALIGWSEAPDMTSLPRLRSER